MTENNVKLADAGAAGWIAYAIASWMAWASLCGYVSDKALLYMAAIALGCTIPYMGAAITELKLGNLAGGVTWLYFGSFFAFGSSINYAVEYFAAIHKWQLDNRILGYEWLILAIVLVLTTPVFMKYSPWTAAVSVMAVDVGLICLALVYFGINVAVIGGWGFFVAGFFAIIVAAGSILEGAGMKFPMGKPMIK